MTSRSGSKSNEARMLCTLEFSLKREQRHGDNATTRKRTSIARSLVFPLMILWAVAALVTVEHQGPD